MRLLVTLCILGLVPLSGCLGGGQPVVASLFTDWNLPAGDPKAVAAPDCDALLETLNQRALAESDAALKAAVAGHGHYGPVALDRAVMFSAAEGAVADSASAAGAEVTGTNNQEADADEGDVLKTDGAWTYVVRGTRLHILHSENVGDAALHATIELNGQGLALLLWQGDPDNTDDDRLLVVSQPYNVPEERQGDREGIMADRMYWGGGWTRVQVYDLADRAEPGLLHETLVEGEHVDARMVEGHAYIVVQDWSSDLQLRTWVYPEEQDLQRRGLTWEQYHRLPEDGRRAILADLALEARVENRIKLREATLEDHLPRVLSGTPPVDRELVDAACSRFLSPVDATGRATTTILSVSLPDMPQAQTTSFVGSSPIVYGTSGSLVLASNSRDSWWFMDAPRVDEATDLQWFDLDGLDVRHRASGRIPGTILDSFAIDVHDDQVRVATTTGQFARWWVQDPAPMLNHILVLEEEAGTLLPVGMVGGIAPGERIWSARFTDERAYIITFEQIDPLWIVDLQDPSAPQVLGELEIPGVSTYIHPLSDDLLLAIGYGPGEGGRGLDWSRVQLSLFDISDTSAPRRAALMDVSPPGGGWSQATSEHKAFTYWSALGVLAIPMETHEEVRTSQGTDYRQQSMLRLVDVDEEAMTLTLRGDVDQDVLGRSDGYGTGIERSYFLGYPGTPIVSVYALSHAGLTAHDLRTLNDQGHVAFDDQEQMYWGRLVID